MNYDLSFFQLTSFKYYKRAAEKGHMDSSVMVSQMYKDGIQNEMEADDEQAAR